MLIVFVEGPDDEAFFKKIFSEYWQDGKFIPYANMKKDKIDNYIKSIKCMPNDSYIFIGDADGKEIETKKVELAKKYGNLSADKVFIVQFEIESWYYAGANEELCKKLKMKNFQYATDNLTKELFVQKLARDAEKQFVMNCILNDYSMSIAIERNKSLKLFWEYFRRKEEPKVAVS